MDSIWINGKFWDAYSHIQAMAVKNGRIHSLGTNPEMLALAAPATKVYDLKNSLVLPGFNDSHVHFMEGGFSLQEVDLRDARSEVEFCERLKAKAATMARGSWITGGYWDHEKWPSKRLPSKELLDSAVPDHPVFIVRLDWHIACANSPALQLAGIDSQTASPAGGVIDRDPQTGEPTGILRDEAERLVYQVIPPSSAADKEAAALAAMHHAAGLGITSVQGECKAEDQLIFSRLAEEHRLTTRMSVWQSVANPADIETLRSLAQVHEPFFQRNTAKLFVDGSFGASTALLFEPYDDAPNYCGLAIHEQPALESMIQEIDRLNWHMAVHAIGDRAVHLALTAFEKAYAQNGERRRRHRLEHAQMVRQQDLARFRDLALIASVQPSHAIDDMRWIENRLGARIDTAYRLRSFLHNDVTVACGTDWTVEPLDPMLTLYAAVSREFPEGGPEGGWQAQEKISLVQAIQIYTEGAAYSEGQEHYKGRLKTGYLADFVLLEPDFLYRSPQAILHSRIQTTVVDGRIVHDIQGIQ
jgi:predicted amidohydrolase YtcJ